MATICVFWLTFYQTVLSIPSFPRAHQTQTSIALLLTYLPTSLPQTRRVVRCRPSLQVWPISCLLQWYSPALALTHLLLLSLLLSPALSPACSLLLDSNTCSFPLRVAEHVPTFHSNRAAPHRTAPHCNPRHRFKEQTAPACVFAHRLHGIVTHVADQCNVAVEQLLRTCVHPHLIIRWAAKPLLLARLLAAAQRLLAARANHFSTLSQHHRLLHQEEHWWTRTAVLRIDLKLMIRAMAHATWHLGEYCSDGSRDSNAATVRVTGWAIYAATVRVSGWASNAATVRVTIWASYAATVRVRVWASNANSTRRKAASPQ
jgi:hypothetical protein